MSSISTTPRRPSTAQPPSLRPRLPYEAGEALLWERQNHRIQTHLAQQLQTLQSQHDAYNARIQATEAVAEAAEAAVAKIKAMERRVRAIEDEDADRPLDTWVKEAVGQLQVAVDGLKGVRQRVSGLEGRVERLGDEVEGRREEGRLLESVVRRVERLEGEWKTKGMDGRGSDGDRQGSVVVHETNAEVQDDDNPLAVFYGIDTQSISNLYESPPNRRQRSSNACRQEGLDGPTQPLPGLTEDLQPPIDDTQPEGDSLGFRATAPKTDYGWENTQQFKEMQRELDELRAMCRTQDPRGGNESADATQRARETIVVHKDRNMVFSDATTEAEAEYDNAGQVQPRVGPSRGSLDVLSSDMHLPSSPPKRTETQSARRNIMKRPSIYDARLSSGRGYDQDVGAGPNQDTGIVKPPVEPRMGSNSISPKRKRIDDGPTQRVSRPKLGHDAVLDTRPPISAATRNKDNDDGDDCAKNLSLNAIDDPLTPASPPRKTCGKQKSAMGRSGQRAAQKASASGAKHNLPDAKPDVSTAEAESRKTVNKPKPANKASAKKSAQAATSSSKTSATVKKEARGSRQPAGACKTCRARHQKCDRTHPTCGRCVKFGVACEYALASGSAAPPNRASTAIGKPKNDANREQNLRERSVTISPEAPQQESPAKRSKPASPSKKSAAAAITAASSRAPRAKKTQHVKAVPQQQKQKQKQK